MQHKAWPKLMMPRAHRSTMRSGPVGEVLTYTTLQYKKGTIIVF
jgi:hypothetical protein